MYLEYFGLDKLPFTISPDPDFLYPSSGHQEALAHLSYALTDQGGLICLTGEVGTGKTTLCRALMASIPEGDHVAYIFNPQLSPIELMQSICDDLGIAYERSSTLKEVYASINKALVDFYAKHQRVICVIDEAQSMPVALLEQVRLLTNLETDREKLLTLVLVGQPELRDLLKRHDLRQLNQRITARYHLELLSLAETSEYVEHRLVCAGGDQMLFDPAAIEAIWRASEGTPRLINSICDRALLGAYATSNHTVGTDIAKQAIIEVLGADYETVSPVHAGKGAAGIAETSGKSILKSALAFCAAAVFVFAGVIAYQNIPALKTVSLDRSDPYAVLEASRTEGAANCDSSGWRCIPVDWDISELRELNQITVVRVGSGGAEAEWYDLEEYERGYAGEAVILWQAPADYTSAVKPGETAPVIRWVRSRLGAGWDQEWTSIGPGGVQVEVNPEFYDPLLERAVAEFQIAEGLKADRIIGPKTLMYLQARQ